MVSGPDFNFYEKTLRWRRQSAGEAGEAPWVTPWRWVAGFARRCESQCRHAWDALPIMRSVVLKHMAETGGTLCSAPFKGKAGEHIDHRKEKVYHAFFVEPVNVNQEVKLSEEHDQSLWVTIDEALAMEESKLSHHARHFLEQMVRNNPGWRHGKQMEDDPFEDEFEEEYIQ